MSNKCIDYERYGKFEGLYRLIRLCMYNHEYLMVQSTTNICR